MQKLLIGGLDLKALRLRFNVCDVFAKCLRNVSTVIARVWRMTYAKLDIVQCQQTV